MSLFNFNFCDVDIVAIPDVLYLYMYCIILKAQLWKISFFWSSETNNENNKGREILRQLFLLEVFQISEWLLSNRNTVGSCGLAAKGNTSVNHISLLCHLLLMCSSTWGKYSSGSCCFSLEAGLIPARSFSHYHTHTPLEETMYFKIKLWFQIGCQDRYIQ